MLPAFDAYQDPGADPWCLPSLVLQKDVVHSLYNTVHVTNTEVHSCRMHIPALEAFLASRLHLCGHVTSGEDDQDRVLWQWFLAPQEVWNACLVPSPHMDKNKENRPGFHGHGLDKSPEWRWKWMPVLQSGILYYSLQNTSKRSSYKFSP